MLTSYLEVQGTNIVCCLWGALGLGGFFFLLCYPLQHFLQLHALDGKIHCGENTLMVNRRLLRFKKLEGFLQN